LGIKQVFVTKFGKPMNAKKWSEHNWGSPLEKLNIRHRKAYAMRHTFITEMVRKDVNLKKIADYCGTSAVMIEQNYCAKLELDPMGELGNDQEVFEKLPKFPNENVVAGPGFEPGTSRL
jgi:integrase